MIARSIKRRHSLYWLVSIFLLTHCSSAPEKSVPEHHIVEIRQMQFQPAELMVAKGDTVVWINQDVVVHDVTEYPTKAWSSSPIKSGESWQMIVVNSANYFCNIHQVMKGKVVIK